MSEEVERVYAIGPEWFGLKLQSAVVEKRTAKQVRLEKGAGDAFGYRTHIPVGADCLAPTPAEAYRRAISKRKAAIEQDRADLIHDENCLKKLEEALEQIITKDQPDQSHG